MGRKNFCRRSRELNVLKMVETDGIIKLPKGMSPSGHNKKPAGVINRRASCVSCRGVVSACTNSQIVNTYLSPE